MSIHMNSNGDTFNVAPVGNISFDKDTFIIDELMAPIIAVLMRKGYMTRACCSGHIVSAYCPNYDDCVEDREVEYETSKCNIIDRPYIMFEDNVELSKMDSLPDEWEWEYTTPASEYIDTEEDARLMRTCNFKPGQIIPVFSRAKDGFNLCIRPDLTFFGLHLDNCHEMFKEDPYRYYAKLVIAHRNLYIWAKNLPERIIDKQRKHKSY